MVNGLLWGSCLDRKPPFKLIALTKFLLSSDVISFIMFILYPSLFINKDKKIIKIIRRFRKSEIYLQSTIKKLVILIIDSIISLISNALTGIAHAMNSIIGSNIISFIPNGISFNGFEISLERVDLGISINLNGMKITLNNILDNSDVTYDTLSMTAENVIIGNDLLQLVGAIGIRMAGLDKTKLVVALVAMVAQALLLIINFELLPQGERPAYGNKLKDNYFGLIIGIIIGRVIEHGIINNLKKGQPRDHKWKTGLINGIKEPLIIQPLGPEIGKIAETIIAVGMLIFGMKSSLKSYNEQLVKGENNAGTFVLGVTISLID